MEYNQHHAIFILYNFKDPFLHNESAQDYSVQHFLNWNLRTSSFEERCQEFMPNSGPNSDPGQPPGRLGKPTEDNGRVPDQPPDNKEQKENAQDESFQFFEFISPTSSTWTQRMLDSSLHYMGHDKYIRGRSRFWDHTFSQAKFAQQHSSLFYGHTRRGSIEN